MTSLILIDNYDSFTYNIVHYFAELGAQIDVVRNDALSAEALLARKPEGIIISPGPGTPSDSGISCDILRLAGDDLPVLGICLGHQAIGEVFGGSIIRTTPMHGKVSTIIHNGKSVFADLPSPFNATRYHSLIIDAATVPDCLDITARTEDGTIMGVAHKTRPLHGVQFHPESIASEHGHALCRNFLTLCQR